MKDKKGEGIEPGSFLMWAIFVLIALLAILYIIWKWDDFANYIGSKIFP
ncbi:MAG: hypothetical protein KKA62_05625 [Nanoarchaeota archaeon]|nr:hypothetical protein [Nanoarchaeota archaeon]MBU1644690.1 hypothetical protein [Nanoarchaeota archaeon]MBU1977403.1 hypothetical protein [Nanoarchaeota archaeon]